jgi:uncharacterized membrane protein YphA (DoxX/SURF4 family)
MNLDVAFLVGRILFGGYFLYNGLNHLMNTAAMAQYAASRGVPAPELAVLGSGLLILLGGATILLGFLPRAGALLIAIFLVGVTPVMHDFWTVSDPAARLSEMVNFTKNLALLGSTLLFAAYPRPWPLSLDRPAGTQARSY